MDSHCIEMANQLYGSIDRSKDKYPCCIVWTPIPLLTWLFPVIGHMGIALSSGVIRDFAGPYYVSEDNMAFGKPTKYWQLHPSLAHGGIRYCIYNISEKYFTQSNKCTFTLKIYCNIVYGILFYLYRNKMFSVLVDGTLPLLKLLTFIRVVCITYVVITVIPMLQLLLT